MIILHDCLFVNSTHVSKNSEYKRYGLDSLCQEFGLMRTSHSAVKDVHLLERVFSNQTIAESYSFPDLVNFLQRKLPVPIHRVYAWAKRCCSVSNLEMMLVRFVRGKTALSEKQVFKDPYAVNGKRVQTTLHPWLSQILVIYLIFLFY